MKSIINYKSNSALLICLVTLSVLSLFVTTLLVLSFRALLQDSNSNQHVQRYDQGHAIQLSLQKLNTALRSHHSNRHKSVQLFTDHRKGKSINRNCSNKWCTSFITSSHRHFYVSCEAATFRKTHIEPASIPARCKFRDGKGRVPVALVSVPGSGNTWVRGLLEKATGICTGSIYCDSPLRNKGFVGEHVHDNSVLVVKTHTSDYQWIGTNLEKRNREDAFYASAILLIRNPVATFVTERHRLKTLDAIRSGNIVRAGDKSHTNEVDKSEFGNNDEWDHYLHAIGERWSKTIVKWFGSAVKQNYSLLILRYEDLKKDSLTQIVRVLDFLNQDYKKTELATKLQDGFKEVQRNHTCQFEHYTDNQKAYVRSMIASTMDKLQSMGINHTELGLTEYLE